jgi:hypothetical protein
MVYKTIKVWQLIAITDRTGMVNKNITIVYWYLSK